MKIDVVTLGNGYYSARMRTWYGGVKWLHIGDYGCNYTWVKESPAGSRAFMQFQSADAAERHVERWFEREGKDSKMIVVRTLEF